MTTFRFAILCLFLVATPAFAGPFMLLAQIRSVLGEDQFVTMTQNDSSSFILITSTQFPLGFMNVQDSKALNQVVTVVCKPGTVLIGQTFKFGCFSK